jgi:hypothetical protein
MNIDFFSGVMLFHSTMQQSSHTFQRLATEIELVEIPATTIADGIRTFLNRRLMELLQHWFINQNGGVYSVVKVMDNSQAQ